MGVLWSEETKESKTQTPIEITADGDNRIVGDVAMAELNVVVHYGDDIVYADKISIDRKTKVIMASGNVRIYTHGKVYRGETLIYNFQTKNLESSDFRMSSLPAFVGGSKITTPEANHYKLKDAYFTTENRENPGFHFKASTVEIYNEQDVVLKDVVLYIGNMPILWVPIFVQSLDDDRANWVFTGGSNSRYGPFGRATYNWYYDKNLRGSVVLDVRQKRGFAGGVNLEYKPNDLSEGAFKGYWAEDNDHKANYTGLPRAGVTSTRYQFEWEQKTRWKDGLSLTLQQELWSDPYVTEDFFENEYRNDRQPDSYIEGVQYNENFTISLLVRDRLNHFYDTTERAPELKIESKRFKLYDHLEYQSEYSLASLRKLHNELQTQMDPLLPPPDGDYSAYRWDTLQQLLYPRQYFNWLSVTPRAGFRATAWSDDNATTPGDRQTHSSKRLWAFAGIESSFKVSKTWLDIKSNNLGIDGIRHVMEPFVNIQVADRQGADPARLRGFDSRLPSDRLQPLNPDQNNSIDSLDNEAVVRHGIRNKIQTKRDGANWDLIDWSIFADLDLARNRDINALAPVTDNLYSDVYSDFKFRPLPWLTYDSYSAVDLNGNSFNLSNNSIKWQMTRSWEMTTGVQILNHSPLYPNSNLLTLSNFYRLNEHWQFENMLSFEADDGRLQEQSYRIYRDLSSWQLALTFADRDNRDGRNEALFYFTLTLKAFPSQKLSF